MRTFGVTSERVDDRPPDAAAMSGDCAVRAGACVGRFVAPASDAAAPEGGLVVMIVDDEPPLVEIAADMVAELGCVPLAFDSGERARAALDGPGVKVDLLLTDEGMPGLSGSELVAAIRAKGWNIPVIMMSGNLTPALRQRARAARVCALLHKPLARDTLAAALARCLRPRSP